MPARSNSWPSVLSRMATPTANAEVALRSLSCCSFNSLWPYWRPRRFSITGLNIGTSAAGVGSGSHAHWPHEQSWFMKVGQDSLDVERTEGCVVFGKHLAYGFFVCHGFRSWTELSLERRAVRESSQSD